MICANMIAFGKAAGATKPYKARLEYLESTGTQYIETGIIPDADTGMKMIADKPINATDVYIAGLRNTAENTRWCIGWDSSAQWYCGYGWAIVSGVNDEPAEVTLNFGNTKTFTVGGDYSRNLPTLGFEPVYNIRIFGSAGIVGSYASASVKIRSAQISQDTLIVCSLIPVLDKAGVPCMYDEVSGEFFYNQGTGEFVAGPIVEQIFYTASDYIQDGLIRQADAIETTGYGKEVYDNGTMLVDLANDVDSGITIGTNVSRDGVLLDVISSISNNVFKNTPTQNVSDAFTNDTFSLEFCGIINNGMVGTYDSAGNGYRLCNVRHVSASQPFYFFAGGESFSATLSNTDKAKTVSITRDGDVCSAYANGEFLGTFTASVSVVPNLLGFYLYADQSMGSYRFYSRALTAEEIAYNYSIDK